MGCGNSKVGVTSVVAPGTPPNTTPQSASAKRPTSKTITVKPKKDADIDEQTRPTANLSKKSRQNSRGSRSAWESQDSMGSSGTEEEDIGGSERGNSASSKNSKHSGDSGFNDEYAKVVTEFSNADKVQKVETEFETPRNLELGVMGQACTQRYSAKDKDRLGEQRVLAALRQEGLIQRPMSRASNGLSFEVVSDNAEMFQGKRPPARLAKLDKRRRKRKPMTEEQLLEKLLQAGERKKELEQQRLAKIQSVSLKSDVQNAMDAFAEQQRSKDEDKKAREETASENRERRLREMRDKLKAKEDYAEKVRKRKKIGAGLAADATDCQEGEAPRGPTSYSPGRERTAQGS